MVFLILNLHVLLFAVNSLVDVDSDVDVDVAFALMLI